MDESQGGRAESVGKEGGKEDDEGAAVVIRAADVAVEAAAKAAEEDGRDGRPVLPGPSLPHPATDALPPRPSPPSSVRWLSKTSPPCVRCSQIVSMAVSGSALGAGGRGWV